MTHSPDLTLAISTFALARLFGPIKQRWDTPGGVQ
jgi:hypothetical protein